MMDIQHMLAADKAGCSGCGACMKSCPVGAIAMKADEYGCLYPSIDDKNCIQCGKCLAVCRRIAETKANGQLSAYAAVGKDAQLVDNSASGGVFAAAAAEWIGRGGMAAGAVMEMSRNGLHVRHILSDRAEDIARMQGSKYVFSEASACYDDVVRALKEGREVLFSGTPCQAAAIKALTGDPANLVTMDIVCHGVPPMAMLREYAEILSERFCGKISGLRFRDKAVGKPFTARLSVEYGRKHRAWLLRSHDLSYYTHFLQGSIYRENCYSCPYARKERVSDITIGDYWGAQKRHEADIAEGRMAARDDWSCVMVNTEKGKAALDSFSRRLQLHETKPEWIAMDNQQLRHPYRKPQDREELLGLYKEGGYRAIERAFIKSKGGNIRFLIRTVRSLRRNHIASMTQRNMHS